MFVLYVNLAILLGLIPVAVLLSWGILRGLDRLAGIDFREELDKLADNPLALSIYFSARFIGVLWLIGTLCSRFV